MAMVYLTRRERFSAAHKLWIDEWSEDENFKTFGKCANPNWHGHNYQLYVTVKGDPNPITGFVVDLRHLSDIILKKVIQKLDHKNVNLDCDFMRGEMSTTENIAIGIWKQLEAQIKEMGATLHCIKIQETENNSVEYFGK